MSQDPETTHPMTDPKAEALARLKENLPLSARDYAVQAVVQTSKPPVIEERRQWLERCIDELIQNVFGAGYDARDEEVASLTIEAKVARGNAAAACTLLELKDTELAALKAEVERLCMAIYDCDAFPGEHLLRAAARAALAAADRKDGEKT